MWVSDCRRIPARLSISRSERRTTGDEEYIVHLLGQVVRVSVETVKLVNSLPAEYAGNP